MGSKRNIYIKIRIINKIIYCYLDHLCPDSEVTLAYILIDVIRDSECFPFHKFCSNHRQICTVTLSESLDLSK